MSAIIGPTAPTTVPSHAPRAEYLIGPRADFLLLGGGSLLVLVLVPLFWPLGADTTQLAAVMVFLTNLINHPHFAHSYQLFYRDFMARAFGDRFPAALRRRYLFAAIGAPLLMIGFFWYCVVAADVGLLGRAVNLMLFLVGWHYVKQGYGMLMVDAVLKRSFFDERGKKVLLWNAYAVWMLSWALVNDFSARNDYWGIEYFVFDFPDALIYALIAVALITSIATARVLYRRWRAGKPPVNGMVAYVTSLYVWLLVPNPAMLLIIPAFHSLQYLTVVWRYRYNMEKSGQTMGARKLAGRGPWVSLALFVFIGIVLGYFGFWRVPQWLDVTVGYDRKLFGGTLFLFLFWVFINVHHYCLDNVMWRKDNPDTRRYLFGAG